MMIMGYFLYVLCFLLSWIFSSYIISLFSRRQRNLPPGPTPLPVIGNFLNLGGNAHASAAGLAKIYGPVMCLQLGSVTTIIVSSPDAAKEVLRKKDVIFSHRAIPDVVTLHNHHKFSAAWLPPHDEWRNIRKIATSLLFSSSSLDNCSHIRREKISEFLTQVEACRQAGVAVNIGQIAFHTTVNLLSNTFFSVDVANVQLGSGSKTAGFEETVWKLLCVAGKPNLSDYFPLLKWFDPQGITGQTDVHLVKLLKYIDGLIDERLEAAAGKRYDDSSNGDILDALLKIIRESTNGQGFNRVFLRHMLTDLFIAGTDTTSITLEWAMTELIKNPMKMKKAQEELNNIIGRKNFMEEADISKLPYLHAVIKETFRLHPPAPFLLPRKSTADVELCGFTVPKNSQVMTNVWAIGRDPNVWKDAKEFQPERFIGSDIDIRGQDFELTPFGAGRRICPGMPLATRMLPMMLVSLIHSYDWKLEDGITPNTLDMAEKLGLTLQKAQPLMIIPVSKK